MEIEKEIKQNIGFHSEFQKLSVNILHTASWLGIMIARRLKPYGLTMQQYNVLQILRGQHPEPATVNMLIDRMIDKSSNASRLVERLLQKKLVDRCTSSVDKRSVNVMITEKGLELLKTIDDNSIDLDEGSTLLSKEEAKTVNKLLDKMRD